MMRIEGRIVSALSIRQPARCSSSDLHETQEIGSPESDRWKLLGYLRYRFSYILPRSPSMPRIPSLRQISVSIQNKQDRHARSLVAYVTKSTTLPRVTKQKKTGLTQDEGGRQNAAPTKFRYFRGIVRA